MAARFPCSHRPIPPYNICTVEMLQDEKADDSGRPLFAVQGGIPPVWFTMAFSATGRAVEDAGPYAPTIDRTTVGGDAHIAPPFLASL